MENYKLKFEPNLKVVIDSETYLPKVKLNINLELFYPAQIDGHMWKQSDVDVMTDQMISEVSESVKMDIAKFIKEAAPYQCYGPPIKKETK